MAPQLQDLIEIRHELLKYNTSPCNLFHEKVTSYTPADAERHIEAFYNRSGFCSQEVRKWRLGCAHTMANHRYLELLKKLAAIGVLPVMFQEEIAQLVMSIYLMDHQKGENEKQFAVASLSGDQLSLAHLSKEMEQIAMQHAEKITRLEALRLAVLNEIEQLFVN